MITVVDKQAALLEPQLLSAVTHILPPAGPTVTPTEVVPCPLLIVHPAGTDHVYEVAPATAEIEYVSPAPAQTTAEPVIGPGAEGGGIMLMDKHVALLVPQALLAVTHILPPDEPDVTLTEVVPCPLTIVHPTGTVHV